jgi:5-methylcytosine-specific restriction enzyme B
MAQLNPTYRPGVELIYPVFARFREDCLRHDRSLFDPDRSVWTSATSEDFFERFVEAPKGEGSFIEQYRAQLAGASDDVVQYAAELFYLYLLIVWPAAISAVKKRELMSEVVGWASRPISLDPELDSALDAGLVRPGTFYMSARHRQISHMAAFFRRWKSLTDEERSAGLSDPWTFRRVLYVDAADGDGGAAQRRALLHIVHPDTFEAITSPAHVDAIIEAFGERASQTDDPDRALLDIRKSLESDFGDMDFYRSPVREPKGPTPAASDPDPEGYASIRVLADELHLPPAFLTEVVELLEDKRQMVLYGPPGTGKTFLAQRLGSHLGAGAVELVQFHPSYTYEDFVEGYRPNPAGGFELRHGPLRRLAARAEANPGVPHILIVDEINRGNVAKVFGELYFLLEYRDQTLSLQYSDEPFRLPENLWLIGTMNTADRSIALMDSALRRRFFFVELSPLTEPIAGLLERWIHDTKKRDMAWVAAVVRAANDRLGDRHAAIGPSHFLRDDLDDGWVRRIWSHAVMPYLAEHFYGEEHRLAEFQLDALRSGLSGVPIAAPVDGDGIEERSADA